MTKSYDFSNSSNQAGWAAKLRDDYENRDRDVTERVVAAINDAQAQGDPLTDDEIRDLHKFVANGGVDWVRPKDKKEDFSNVKSTTDTVLPEPPGAIERGNAYMGQQLDELKTIGSGVLGSLESKALGAAYLAGDNPDMVKKAIGMVLPLQAARLTPKVQAAASEAVVPLAAAAASSMDAYKAGADDMKKRYPAWMVDTVGDVTQSPESAASIIGGPAAVLPGTSVFLQEYGQSRAAGVSPDESLLNAGVQGGTELGIEAIPSGKLLSKLPVVGPMVKRFEKGVASSLESRLGQAIHVASRTALTATGEGLEEGVTGVVQDAARRLQGLVGSEKAMAYAQSQVIPSGQYMENIMRQARAGAFMGGPIGGLEAAVTGAQEGANLRGAREQKLSNTINVARGNALLGQDQTTTTEDTNLNQDLKLELQRKQAAEDKQAAFDQAERDAAKQKELEQEAGYQTIQRDSGQPTSKVEKYAGVVERTPVHPAREVTAEDVASQRATEQRTEAERVDRVELGTLTEQLRARQAANTKRAAGETAKAEKAARTADGQRRRVVMDQLLAENPDATPADLAPLMRIKMAEPAPAPVAKTTEKPLEQRITDVRTRLESAQKAKVTKMQNERIKVAVRNNPNLSVEDLAAQLRQEGVAQTEGTPLPTTAQKGTNPIPPPTKSDAALSQDEEEVNKLVAGMGLGMAATKADLKAAGKARRGETTTEEAPAAVTEPTEDRATRDKRFGEKGRTFVKAIAGRTNKDSHDFQTLLHQGKIVVGLNAADLGREEAGRGAEYDMGTGKMYVYLDGIDAANPISSIAAALHETTHALITPEEVAAISGKLRAAAKNGNTHAKKALQSAQADTTARNGDDQHENEELVAYFAGHAKEAEGKTLGTAGAAVRDLVSAARGGIRKHLGIDLNVNIGEVATALSAGLNDATKTDIKGRGKRESLGMIAGRNATGFRDAVAKGKNYQGKVDNLHRFEIPDTKAEILDPAVDADKPVIDSLLAGKHIPLDEVLDHKLLFTNYPQLKDTTVQVNDVDALASYQPGPNRININRTQFAEAIKSGNTEKLRELILHETQHAVQRIEGFVSGASAKHFLPNTTVREYKDALEKVDNIAKNFDLGAAVKGLNFETKKSWDAFVKWSRPDTLRATSALFLSNQEFVDNTTERTAARTAKAYAEALNSYRGFAQAYNAAVAKAYQVYLRDYGETEARNTEHRSRMSEEELAANPPESTMQNAEGKVPVEKTIDTGPIGPTNVHKVSDSATLGMAQSPERKAVRRSSAVVNSLPEIWGIKRAGEFVRKVGTGQLSNSKFLGHDLLEAFEHSKSLPAGEEARAMAVLGKYDTALHALAVQRGMDPHVLDDQIGKELEAATAKTEGYTATLAAYNAVASKYGEAGKHLMTLRDQVDEATKATLRLRAQSSNKPSAEEAKTIKTMVANLGRYSHRLYALHQGVVGKKWAKAVQQAYMKGKNGRKLTPAESDTFDMMRRAATTLIDNSLMIPDDAGIAEMGGDQLTRVYRTWGSQNVKSMSLDQMRDELADIRESINGDTDRLQKTADDILKQILGLNPKTGEQPIATYFRGAKQDRGILQQREHIPEEIRAVMGEITSPGTRLLATVAKQSEFVARTKFLLEVQKTAKPEDLQPPGSTGTDTVLENHMTELKGEGFGPLEGSWVSPNLRAMIDEVRETSLAFEDAAFMAGQQPGRELQALMAGIINKWPVVAGFSKRVQIVGKLILMPVNFAGAMLMPLNNGNINPATYAKGLRDAGRIIAYEINPSLGLGFAEDPVKYGVTDSATVGELKGLPHEKIEKMVTLMAGKKPSYIFKAAKIAGITLQQTYAMCDVWAKIANYHNEVNILTRFNKLNNGTMSEEQIKRTAADITNRTNITYKRAMPLFKSMERQGFTNFGPYFYEVFRSQIGNAVQGIGEIVQSTQASTAAAGAYMASRGMARLGGQATYWTAASMFTRALAGMLFGHDDDEWDKRSLFGSYAQSQDLFPVGLDKDGKPVYYAVSNIDAIGPITDIMRQVRSGGMTFDQAKESLLNLYVKPRLVPQIIMAGKVIFSDTGKPRDPLVQEWSPNGYQYVLKAGNLVGMEDKTVKALTNVLEAAAMPGTLTATRSTNPDIAAPGPAGSGVEQMAQVAKLMGATFVKPDPAKVISFAKMDYDDYQKKARAQMFSLFHDRPNITDSEIISNLNETAAEQQKYWNEVARVYRGMKATDMKPADIAAALKQAQISGELLKQIKANKFEPTVVSKESFVQLAARNTQDMTQKDKLEAKKKWDSAWDRLHKVQEGSK